MPSLSRWHIAWVVVVAAACILASAAAFRRHATPLGPLSLTGAPTPAPSSTAAPVSPGGPVYVHVTGHVARAGVYKLAAGSRVLDAITKAGGATESADLDALNLASPLRDGQKITVPAEGEAPPPVLDGYVVDSPAPPAPPEPFPTAPPPPDPVSAAAPAAESAITPADIEASPAERRAPTIDKLRSPGDGTVNINTASSGELQRLPGVGPATAAKIIAYREEHDGFQTVEELMEVKGIGPAKLRKMQPFVTLQGG